MRESLDTFVKSPQNASVCKALDSLNGLRPLPLKLFIEGPQQAGKSALVRGWAEDAARNGAGEAVFACSGADIAMALQFEADDSFFDKLGATAVLLVDELEPLLRAERGDQLLSLLLAERDRLGLSTVITSRTPPSAYDVEESANALTSFEVMRLEPLDDEGKRAFVRLVATEYGTADSARLREDAVAYLVESKGAHFADLEHAVRYLVTDEDCAAQGELDAPTVQKLLSA